MRVIRSGQPHQQRPADDDDDDDDDELRHVGESFALLLQLLRLCTNWNELVSSDAALGDALARLTEHEFTGGTMGFGVHTERTVERLASVLTVTDSDCESADTVSTVIDSSESADSVTVSCKTIDTVIDTSTKTDRCELADSGTVSCKITVDTMTEPADTGVDSCELDDTGTVNCKTTDTVIDTMTEPAETGIDICELDDTGTVNCKTTETVSDTSTDSDSYEFADVVTVSCMTTDTVIDTADTSPITSTDVVVDDRPSQDVPVPSARDQITAGLGDRETELSVNTDSDDVDDRLTYPDTTAPVDAAVIDHQILDASVPCRTTLQQQQQGSASTSDDASHRSSHAVPDSPDRQSTTDEDIPFFTEPLQQNLELGQGKLGSARDESTDSASRPADTEYTDNMLRVTLQHKSRSSVARDDCVSCQQPLTLVARDICVSCHQPLSHELQRSSAVCKRNLARLFLNLFSRRLSKCYPVAKSEPNL